MSTLKKRKRKHCQVVKWIRDDGRLIKLDREAELLDNDILMFDFVTVQTNLQKRACIEQPIPTIIYNDRKDKMSIDTSTEDSVPSLLKLPCELVGHIIRYLDVQSVENLSKCCTSLQSMIESSYLIHMMLPNRKLETLATSNKLSVLKLTVSVCLKVLQDPVTRDLPFKNLNLHKLKELKLCGTNFMSKDQLSDDYIDCLEFLLNSANPHTLTSLEFVVDSTTRIPDRIVPALKKLKSLKSLILHGDLLKAYKKSDVPILTTIIHASYATHVHVQSHLNKRLNFSSPWIEKLTVAIGKLNTIRLVGMKNLIEFNLYDNYVYCTCLACYEGGDFKNILAKNAPNIRFYNKLDLKQLSEMNSNGTWLQVINNSDPQQICNLSKEVILRFEVGDSLVAQDKNIFKGYDVPSILEAGVSQADTLREVREFYWIEMPKAFKSD